MVLLKAAGFNAASGWTLVSGTANSANAIYRVGSKKVTAAQAFGSVDLHIPWTLPRCSINYSI